MSMIVSKTITMSEYEYESQPKNHYHVFIFLPYCDTVAKKEASENQYTSNYYNIYYLCTTIVLILFATYELLLGSGISFNYHSATYPILPHYYEIITYAK